MACAGQQPKLVEGGGIGVLLGVVGVAPAQVGTGFVQARCIWYSAGAVLLPEGVEHRGVPIVAALRTQSPGGVALPPAHRRARGLGQAVLGADVQATIDTNANTEVGRGAAGKAVEVEWRLVGLRGFAVGVLGKSSVHALVHTVLA